jgi:hypothetical protein
MATEKTWEDLKDVADMFGMTFGSIKNAIAADTFPVPTYKLGRRLVVDKDVLKAYFDEQKEAGLNALRARPKPARGTRR